MPTLNWIGKEAVINHHLDVPFHLLKDVPDLSCGDPGSGNLIVEGDNLLALKALLPYYKGKVKCICIDPPYNTGNEGWAYNDNVNSPAIKKWLGETVGKEGETLDRHDRWLCMMYPRLALLREFLSEEGSIWVFLDDNEIHALRYVLEEVFGGQNFVTTIAWQKKYAVKNDSEFFSASHDYIMIFAKSRRKLALNRLQRTEEQDARFANPDNDPRGPWSSGPLQRNEARDYAIFPIKGPGGKIHMPPNGTSWRFTKEKIAELVVDDRIWFGASGNNVPRLKRFLSEVMNTVIPITWWDYKSAAHNDEARREIKDLFPADELFSTPKPTRLIERILQIATNPGDLVLDSFAGSGTTGHAVLKMNAAGERSADTPVRIEKNGGEAATNEEAGKSARAPLVPSPSPGTEPLVADKRAGAQRRQPAEGCPEGERSEATRAPVGAALEGRRFILVEMDEKIAPDITRERVKRVAEGYTNAKKENVPGLGGGFRYVRLGEAVFDEHGRIRESVRFADLARHVYFTETGEPLPKERVSTKTPLLGIHHSRAVYLLYNGILKDKSVDGGNALCRETLAIILEHSAEHPGIKQTVVYGTSQRLAPARLKREGIVFKQIPYSIRDK